MVRRARFSRRLLMCLLPLAVAACGDEAIPPATGPAHQTPTITVTASPEPTVTATTTPTPEPTATVTATAEPTPTPTPPPTATPEPTPTPEARPIEYTEVTVGEPRLLPAGIALYFWVWPCTECDAGPIDLGRIVFDEAVGKLSFDRPLAFFDDVGPFPATVIDFGVSGSGQTMAATICETGFCFDCWVGNCLDYGSHPTVDAELRLRVSRDDGLTWEDWGLVLPGTTISEVTDEDVRLRTWNIWDSRGDWDLTDEEWEEMLARLEPLGLGELEEGGFWDRWVVSGKEPAPSAPGGREPGHEMLRWSAEVEGLQLFAIADEEGVVEQVYGSVQPLWAPSRPHDLLLRPVSLPTPYFPAIFHFRTGPLDVALLDLATLTFHQVDGLSMRTEDLFAARPAPAPAEAARPAVDYEPLTMGEPRPLPAGTAVYYLQHHCEGAWDTHRVVANPDAGTLVVDRPLAFFDTRPDRSVATVLAGVSESGRTLAARECERGVCPSMYQGSEDAMYALWVSGDAGATWERWGEMAVEVGILAVAEDDVAVFLPASGAGGEAAAGGRAWWYRSGEELPFPQGAGSAEIAMWRPSEAGLTPVWVDRSEGAFLDASGERLATPPPADAAAAEAVWWPVAGLPGGSLLWSASPGSHRAPEEPDLFVTMDEQGEVTGAYSWEDPQRIRLVD